MLKIASFIGSLRAGSLNRATFNAYRDITSADFEHIEIPIHNLPLYNQDIPSQPEAVIDAASTISGADAILFFSPEYNYSIPGALKNAIDWLSRCDPNPFSNKPTAIIGASPGQIGTGRMQYHLRQVAVFLNMHVLNKPEVMIGSAFDKFTDGKLTDNSTIEFLKSHANSFKEFISKHG